MHSATIWDGIITGFTIHPIGNTISIVLMATIVYRIYKEYKQSLEEGEE